jgi:hypothetical protein
MTIEQFKDCLENAPGSFQDLKGEDVLAWQGSNHVEILLRYYLIKRAGADGAKSEESHKFISAAFYSYPQKTLLMLEKYGLSERDIGRAVTYIYYLNDTERYCEMALEIKEDLELNNIPFSDSTITKIDSLWQYDICK